MKIDNPKFNDQDYVRYIDENSLAIVMLPKNMEKEAWESIKGQLEEKFTQK